MSKKVYHKNSKRAVSKIRKLHIRKGIKEERILFLDKVIILLYLAVGFFPHMNAFDVAITQWYYISIVNVITLVYLKFYKNFIEVDFHHKIAKFTFLGALLFLFISCLSIVKSISVSESIVFICILLNTLIAFFNLYLIVKDKLVELFLFIVYTVIGFLVIESLQVIHHFAILNGSEPRSGELFLELNPTYGNRNILAASLIVKLAFTFYVFFRARNKFEYFLSLCVIYISVFAILIIGARTAIYSLPIIFLILITGKFYVDKHKAISELKKYLTPLLIILSLSLISALSINKIHKGKFNKFADLVFTKKKKDLYRGEDIEISFASDSGRKEFWVAALNGFQSNPVLGVGLGNWKLIKKEELIKSNKNGNHFYPRRVHNDFLQVLSEVGVLGFLLFIGLFGLVYYVLIISFFKEKDKDLKLIVLVTFSGFIAYSLDSLINFPSERTPIQILGFLLIVIALSLLKRTDRISIHKYLKYGLIGLGIILIYLNHQMFTSAKYQMIVSNNIRGKNILEDKYKIGYDQMNKLYPSFPTLNFMGQPIDYAKAVLAYSEGKYIQAMNHLDLAIKESPHSLEHYAFKSMIFRSNKLYRNQDSSIHYAQKVFYQRPGLINQYRILKKYYVKEKDTLLLLDLINKHHSFLPKNEDAWIDKINFYLKYPKNLKRAFELIDSAKVVLPDSERVQGLKIFGNKSKTEIISGRDGVKIKKLKLQSVLNNASKLFSQKKYNDAYLEFNKGLQMSPKNENIRLSLALTDIKLKRYKEAIQKLDMVIQSNKVTNGKPEYNRGLCHLRLNNKEAAGIDFRTSYKKGFSMAKSLDKRILNY
ncbi:hypothetical protein BTO06_02325 [Tenacibaculum sp. SZ-18]|uniref:O-antigen ligase family protein n=1 Tax=Tenacibaculum sp. SZ-18 TaxID=754423 RepID=UPI000C2D33C5|nr:O-antigen ligase family protein [Tenacibaculum sp. SZ-18]AUC14065.1 hypothetical protein BTO06_02325 [Tenacibaculum sp. SZ-18]